MALACWRTASGEQETTTTCRAVTWRQRAKKKRGETTCGPQFWFFEVNYGELLKMGSFFLFHTNLGVAKLQVLGNKICQTVRDAHVMRRRKQGNRNKITRQNSANISGAGHDACNE
jgi:hypothetical protein